MGDMKDDKETYNSFDVLRSLCVSRIRKLWKDVDKAIIEDYTKNQKTPKNKSRKIDKNHRTKR